MRFFTTTQDKVRIDTLANATSRERRPGAQAPDTTERDHVRQEGGAPSNQPVGLDYDSQIQDYVAWKKQNEADWKKWNAAASKRNAAFAAARLCGLDTDSWGPPAAPPESSPSTYRVSIDDKYGQRVAYRDHNNYNDYEKAVDAENERRRQQRIARLRESENPVLTREQEERGRGGRLPMERRTYFWEGSFVKSESFTPL